LATDRHLPIAALGWRLNGGADAELIEQLKRAICHTGEQLIRLYASQVPLIRHCLVLLAASLNDIRIERDEKRDDSAGT